MLAPLVAPLLEGTYLAVPAPDMGGLAVTTPTPLPYAQAATPVLDYAGQPLPGAAAVGQSQWEPLPLAGPPLVIQPGDLGYAGWAYDPAVFDGTGNALPTAGVIQLIKIPLLTPKQVSSVRTYVTAAGVTLTAGQCFAGLYDSAGNLISTSADQSAAWAGTGVIDAALTATPVTAAPPHVWAAYLFNGTTGPSLARTGSTQPGMANGRLTAAKARVGSILSGQTSLPASINPANIALTAIQFWAAIW